MLFNVILKSQFISQVGRSPLCTKTANKLFYPLKLNIIKCHVFIFSISHY